MKMMKLLMLAAGLAILAAPARAFVPQTINIDGVNDFDPSNLLDDDRGDTEIKDWCPADADNDSTMDIGRVFVTNDATFLYLGWDYFEDCFGDVQLGIAIDVNSTPAGGVDDPFTRKIGWAGLTNKPDAYIYIEETPFNYEIFYRWDGGAWRDSTILINPAGSGSNALGATNTSRFIELKIPLTALRTSGGQVLNIETWMTQNGAMKGPLDAMCSDNVQMSRATGTTFDTAAVVQMTCTKPYTVFTVIDNTPPTVAQATAVSFPLLANKQFNTATNKVDVLFSEPVGTGAATAANYVMSGASSPAVISAIKDLGIGSLVHLTLGSTVSANAAFFNCTVSNVKDIAGNTIVANGTTNVGSFFIQNLNFEGNVKLRLCKGEFAATDSFYVEGSLLPLTFSVGDNARLLDANTDSVYTGTVPFCIPKNRITGKAEADLEWKLAHTPAVDQYEPGSNRMYHLSSDSGSVRTLSATWGNDNVADFTSKSIDVIFKVNANAPYVTTPPNPPRIWLQGNQTPLSFNIPGTPMLDNGVNPDQTAGDRIYTLRVRFPRCTPKNVGWKVAYDSAGVDTVFECLGQGDRNVFLNDAVFDTVGGAGGPITLAARGVNRCNITDKAVAVTFRVQMGTVTPLPGASDTVGVIGNHSPRVTGPAHAFPMSQAWPPLAGARLFDNGVAPDFHSADGVFTRTLVFPESSGVNVNFKYWLNRNYECDGFGDRTFTLDDVNHSVASPMLRNVDKYNYCSDLVDVAWGPNPADAVAEFGILRQSYPNPATARMAIRFDLKRSGRATLRVYDVGGRHVTTLVDAPLEAGSHAVSWNARDAAGRRVRSGIYVYELALGNDRLVRRMVVTQ